MVPSPETVAPGRIVWVTKLVTHRFPLDQTEHADNVLSDAAAINALTGVLTADRPN